MINEQQKKAIGVINRLNFEKKLSDDDYYSLLGYIVRESVVETRYVPYYAPYTSPWTDDWRYAGNNTATTTSQSVVGDAGEAPEDEFMERLINQL